MNLIEINEEKLTEVLKRELHGNNQMKIKEMLSKNSIQILNFYMKCESCSNTVSANLHYNRMYCGEYCYGCKSVVCYECIPLDYRYCKTELGSKKIEVRDNNDKRFNKIVTIDRIKRRNNGYCESCAFNNLKNGLCMVKNLTHHSRMMSLK